MDWYDAEKDGDNVKIPHTWLHLHYFDAFSTLFRIENALRLFVYIVLKTHYKEKWVGLTISNGEKNTGILDAVKVRISQDRDFGYLSYETHNPFMHLTSGELTGIITSDSYWKHFKEFFKCSKDVVASKLVEMVNIRNSLAHFRPVKEDSVKLLKINSKFILSEIESLLTNILSEGVRMPSNSSEVWYKDLSELNGLPVSETCRLDFQQSVDHNWIYVILTYSPVVPDAPGEQRYSAYINALHLVTPKILEKYQALKNNVICMYELKLNRESMKSISRLSKSVVFVYRYTSDLELITAIKNDYQLLIKQMDEESSMIMANITARGDLIDVKRMLAVRNKERWELSMDTLNCPNYNVTHAEYWGDMETSYGDYISHADKFPWIPIRICSEIELPF